MRSRIVNLSTFRRKLATVVALVCSGTAVPAEDLFPRSGGGPGRATLFVWDAGAPPEAPAEPEGPLTTDRPDFTEASSTVGSGVGQLELGYTLTEENGAGAFRSHSYPEALFRYGVLADWLELRVGTNFATQTFAGNSASGAEDLYLGLKLGIAPQSGVLPEMALVPQVTVPTGSDAFTSGEALPGVNLLYGWDVNDWLSTGGSTQFNRALDDSTDAAYTEWAQSWTVGCGLTDRCSAYTEWFAFFPHSADTARTQHYFNGGLTFLVNDDIQWDVRAGRGLNDAADDYFVGAGMSFRFR